MKSDLQWDDKRISKLSIWFTAYISWYVLMLTPFVNALDVWGVYASFGFAVLMATLTLRVIFHTAIGRDLIRLIDWATGP